MSDKDIAESTSNLKMIFDALVTHYEKAAKENKLDRWAKAAHSVIDLWELPVNRDVPLPRPYTSNLPEVKSTNDETE
jgi:hypothetical protein